MIRRLVRWAFYALILALVLLVAGFLLLDTIAKNVLEMEVGEQTGLEARIGKMSVGLLTPTVTIEDCELHNSARYGGALLLNIREMRVEYDLDELWQGRVRIPALRLNLQEIDRVLDDHGRSNFEEFGKIVSTGKDTGAPRSAALSPKFTGIEKLNLTVNRGRLIFVGHPEANREVTFGIENQTFSRVNSMGDLQTLIVYLDLQSGGYLLQKPFLPAKPAQGPPKQTSR
jgi:uncharacterized protein involved in outer membrane biogenesis